MPLGSHVRLAVALIVAALVAGAAVPALADASPRAKVRAELRLASAALDRVWVEPGDDGSDEDPTADPTDIEGPTDGSGDDGTVDPAAIADNLAYTARARALAANVPAATRPAALAEVALQADDNLYEYIDDVSWVDAATQAGVVTALAQSVDLRDGAALAAMRRAAALPAKARSKMLDGLVGALTDGDPDAVLELLADDVDVDVATKESLMAPLGAMLADTQPAVTALNRSADKLEGAERAAVRRAVTELEQAAAGVSETAAELLDEFADFDDPAAMTAEFCGFLGRLPVPAPPVCG